MCGSRKSRRRGSEMQMAGKARRLVTQLDEEAVCRSIGYEYSLYGRIICCTSCWMWEDAAFGCAAPLFPRLSFEIRSRASLPPPSVCMPPSFYLQPTCLPSLQRRILFNFSHLPSRKSLRIPLLSDCISLLYPSLLSLFVSLSSYL